MSEIQYPAEGTLKWYQDMAEANRLIVLDFPTKPELRRPHLEPIHPRILAALSANRNKYREILLSFNEFRPSFDRISSQVIGTEPGWINDWLPGMDGISLYSFLVRSNPRYYVEIGSGISTQFARRAIRDWGLKTKIISIDPFPRQGIDAICDEIIRQPFESASLDLFSKLGENDIVFCDNSHRSFQNSDVTVFMTEVIPTLMGKETLVGIHDVFLPYDYPESWNRRFYNEQYLLVGYILGGAISVELPCMYCTLETELLATLDPIWSLPQFADAPRGGGTMWLRV